MGIRGRIVALAGAAVAMAVITAAIGSYLAVRGELLGQVDDSLNAQAQGIEALAGQTGGFRRARVLDRDPGPPQAAPPLTEGGLRAQRLRANGSVSSLPRSGGSLPIGPAERAIAAAGRGMTVGDKAVDGQQFRVVTVGIGQQGAIMLGRSLEGVSRVLDHLRLILALLVFGGIALAAGLAFFIGRRVVAPIKKVTETAEHITATNDLARRIDVDGSDEVARLASRFNAMLETIAEHQEALGQSVTSQRQLVADASHELRTPVSAIRTDIEVLLAHPELTAGEQAKILASADERIEELTELILDLIELARGDQGSEEADQVRLDLLVEESVQRLRRLEPERRIEVSLRSTVVVGRPDRLFRAVNNLLDNAVKYSPPETAIEVVVAEGTVAVCDHGPGIPDADLPRLFDRFWRGSTSRNRPGSGLGLAIVRQVAVAGHGQVTVGNLGRGGACFRLSFPAVEPTGALSEVESEALASPAPPLISR
jgi:two-component system, OmpR family, sensor histidine kinase MprB